MTLPERVVIAGASVAGVSVAAELCRGGFSGDIVIVNEEAHAPYDRPPLSKQFLSGAWDREHADLWLTVPHDAVTMLNGVRVTSIDPSTKFARLSDGTSTPYDKLVVATGARARSLSTNGLAGVHTLRSLDDALAIHSSFAARGPVVVVGAGFIGNEIASTAAELGLEVTMVDVSSLPLADVVGPVVAEAVMQLHQDHDVRLEFAVGVDGFEGTGQVTGVRLTNGTRVRAATVVVGIGVVPNVELLAGTGADLVDGVLCDEAGRVRGLDDVYAVGDVARWCGPAAPGRRVEHWTSAVEQAATVAASIVDPVVEPGPRGMSYFWSDLYGVRLQMVGRGGRAEAAIIGAADGTPLPRAVVYAEDGNAVGALTVDWPRGLSLCRRALNSDGTDAAGLIERLRAAL
ncbi:MAG TPA: FAD/NAD(P)-binding oxidoreductase [Ilumatobacter sp.]|nr:FAD/NAD(P)-binding oxidoreductase [Ilumatobacter sp.]